MKKANPILFALPFLLNSFFANAQKPGTINSAITPIEVKVNFEDEYAFVSKFSSYGFKTPEQIDLNRNATSIGFKNVYGFNIPADKNPIGFKWNNGDEETNEWRPQGIAGFQKGSKRYLIVTWYAIDASKIENVYNEFKGARISLVDISNMNNIKYRHILLVQEASNKIDTDLFDQDLPKYKQLKDFIPVTTHAGGVTCFAGKIYIADTNLGIRVFELNKIVGVESNPTEDSIGNNMGRICAFNYDYILPQSGYYKLPMATPFSSVEIGEGESSDDKIMWTGQYFTESEAKKENRTPKIYGFSINAQGILTNLVTRIIPKDKETDVVYGMQGVYREGNKTYMTITGTDNFDGSTARLLTYVDGADHATRYRWPHGAEDLYLEKIVDSQKKLIYENLWCLTEYETEKNNKDNRCVFAVKLSDYP
ncbi:MAG: hypothetical protein IPP86_04455 [Bacteroidetes bacterium]|nr:hypothetical protein [Bacteroidota bacterium]